ncbi:unnamed protein product [Protopolystoma xenopodis]|uniref:Uncharacterized protein n=1 Tax=Protopolystoma xenopodis TaxID=117903 RepID=A0A448XJC3_9PLAT|nr:unnamed protein product [Protopolystoma xenopodis]
MSLVTCNIRGLADQVRKRLGAGRRRSSSLHDYDALEARASAELARPHDDRPDRRTRLTHTHCRHQCARGGGGGGGGPLMSLSMTDAPAQTGRLSIHARCLHRPASPEPRQPAGRPARPAGWRDDSTPAERPESRRSAALRPPSPPSRLHPHSLLQPQPQPRHEPDTVAGKTARDARPERQISSARLVRLLGPADAGQRRQAQPGPASSGSREPASTPVPPSAISSFPPSYLTPASSPSSSSSSSSSPSSSPSCSSSPSSSSSCSPSQYGITPLRWTEQANLRGLRPGHEHESEQPAGCPMPACPSSKR